MTSTHGNDDRTKLENPLHIFETRNFNRLITRLISWSCVISRVMFLAKVKDQTWSYGSMEKCVWDVVSMSTKVICPLF